MRVDTRSLASRLDSGSSMQNTCGWRTIARPMATRWRWPPERAFGLRSRYCSRSRIFAASSTRLPDLRLRLSRDLEREAHVVGHRHVRVERVVLEHHRDVAVLRGHAGDVPTADQDPTRVDVLEAREHPQRGGLATAGGPDEDEELAVGDLEVELVHRGLGVARIDATGVVIGQQRPCWTPFVLTGRNVPDDPSEWRRSPSVALCHAPRPVNNPRQRHGRTARRCCP